MPEGKKINIEQLIEEYTSIIAKGFNQAAKESTSEEDVRQRCNALIDNFIEKAGLQIKSKNEYSIAGGRIDSKYGGVIIEYKNPKGTGKITENINAPGTVKVINQIKSRFETFELTPNLFEEKIFGVGLDGDTIVYVEKSDKEWKISSPQPVTEISVQKLLRALISVGARGKAYTPENLAEDFGAGAENTAQQGVRALYNAISKTDSKKAETLFKQWGILFGEVCGYDVEGKATKIDELAKSYIIAEIKPNPAKLLFAVHTYYAIFMKLLAAEIASSFSTFRLSIIKDYEDTPTNELLKDKMSELESGGIWHKFGITNFLEGNLFSWYVDAWNENIAKAMRQIVRKLDEYDIGTLAVEPETSRDLLKKLYNALFPRKVRHDLGEYYTPDWLAEYTLDELGYDGNPDKRLLDPACGSGTFLVMAINKIKKWYKENTNVCGFGETQLRKKILDNIIGFDLNPLAIMAARTNYLMAIRDFLKFGGGFEIPIYLCDSIMTPAQYKDDLFNVQKLQIAALNEPLQIPAEITESREIIAKYTEEIEQSLGVNNEPEIFVERLKYIGLPANDNKLHENLYEKLLGLKKQRRNGVWARIIKNAFAPLFIGEVDYIAGNPPWVNWESLPKEYRKSLVPLYEDYYKLFPIKGQQRRLGSAKIDIASLFTYVCADEYMKESGKLGFVITQSVFKTKGAGKGFRQFKLPEGKGFLNNIRVNDLTDFQPFEGAVNRTAIFMCGKGQKPVRYPVPYIKWRKRKTGKIKTDYSLNEVLERTERFEFGAIPVDRKKITSPWLTAPKDALKGIKKVIGKSDYTAHAGVYSGGVNGVYWIEVIEELPDGNLLIKNLYDVGKKKVKPIETVIEPDYVYPLLRGRDVKRWNATPSCHIIMVHDPVKRIGIPESEMKINSPKTYAYLLKYKDVLLKRASSSVRALMEKGAFYSMFAVGKYTMAEWKVVWRYIAVGMISSVTRNIMPDCKLMLVACKNKEEAYYLSACLNSSPIDLMVRSFGIGTQLAPHLLTQMNISIYNNSNARHVRLSELSEKCHKAAKQEDEKTIALCETEIDQIAAEIWGITDKELKAIQKALGK